MADFAKSIFGLGSFYKREPGGPDKQQGATGVDPESDKDRTPVLHGASDEPQGFSASNEQYDYPGGNGPEDRVYQGNSKFLPRGLANVTPTTAVSTASPAYGFTLTNPEATNSEDFLQRTFKSRGAVNPAAEGGPADNQNPSSQHSELSHHTDDIHSYPSQNLSTNTSQDSNSAQMGDGGSSHPLIITTDESGHQKYYLSKNSSQPKGKLKITILQARDLLINSPVSLPYVVCTFESSEFVTHTPASYNKSLSHNSNLNRLQSSALPMASRDLSRKGKAPPLYKRQSSTQHLQLDNFNAGSANPAWNHEATFDVVGSKSELDISVYDSAHDDSFLGHVRIFPPTTSNKLTTAQWFDLKARIMGERVSGAIKVKCEYTSLDKKLYGPDDFEILRLLGKGTFGQVYQVKKKDTDRIYAMKVLSKKVIVKKKEIAHTIGERNILVRTSAAASPFIVGLKFSFQTPSDLYLVTDYMSGGELFWHLQKEGRFSEDRAKFYIAELVLALEHLHDSDIVYRDLKPENILLDANGHISLCDFGLSKANLNNDGTTNTFCGTTEYLAPEVLLDESGYTKMVDFWSLGVLIFEMCCGWSPFYADNTQQMYKNIAFGKVRFPKEVLSAEGRSFVKGLLNRNPKHRLGATNDASELRAHPFFHDIDWELLKTKNIPPPFKPHISSETDTSNFDPEFTNEPTANLRKHLEIASTPLSPGIQANFKGFTYVDDSAMEDHFGRSYRVNAFKNPGSFIPGDPNLPPDEDVIDDEQDDESDSMDVDPEHVDDDEQFVNGRFDL